MAISSLSLAQESYQQEIANLATIMFPAAPGIQHISGRQVYSFAGESAIYVVTVTDIGNTGMVMEGESDLDEFYEGVVKGVMNAAKGKLISKKKVMVNGLKGIDIEYVSDTNPNLPALRFQRSVFFNNKSFAISFWTTPENKNSTAHERNTFFNSFAPSIVKEKIVQFANKRPAPAPNSAGNIGYGIGKLIGTLLLPAVIVLLIVYFVRKGKRNK